MLDLQTAADAARGTSQLVLDGAGVTALLAAGGLIVRDYVKARKRNGNLIPGKSQDCLEHRDRLTKLEGKQTDMKEDIVEIKGDVKKLLERIPPRG